jgi:hypothetical protein
VRDQDWRDQDWRDRDWRDRDVRDRNLRDQGFKVAVPVMSPETAGGNVFPKAMTGGDRLAPSCVSILSGLDTGYRSRKASIIII